jgi:aminopeptidase N
VAGLRACNADDCPERSAALAAFYERWQDKPVILDAWFGLEASTPFGDGVARVRQLLEHPASIPPPPIPCGRCWGASLDRRLQFHAADGRGYRFMAEQIAALDQRNPITASRMAKLFSRWQSYGPERSARMREALEQLAAAPLSTNSREVVDQCLAVGPASSRADQQLQPWCSWLKRLRRSSPPSRASVQAPEPSQ